MPIYTEVVASRLAKYRQIMERDGNDADLDTAILKYVICQLVDAAFSGGGGGGSGGGTATELRQIDGNNSLSAIDVSTTQSFNALTEILAELRDDTFVSESVWFDRKDVLNFYIRRITFDQDTQTPVLAWYDKDNNAASPDVSLLIQGNATSELQVEIANQINAINGIAQQIQTNQQNQLASQITQAQVQAAIQSAADIDAILARLLSIDTKATTPSIRLLTATDTITPVLPGTIVSDLAVIRANTAPNIPAQIGSPIWIRDVALAVINTTTINPTVTPTWGDSFQIEVIVTAITGVGARVQVTVQETIDENFWIDVYKFEPITTTGSFRSMIVPCHGAKYRTIETVTGTTPVITRLINRLQRNGDAPTYDAVVKRRGAFNLLNTGFDIPLYGRTRRIVSNNRTAALYFWQIHDSPAAIVSGAVPINSEVYQLLPNSTLPLAGFGEHGTVLGVNPRLVLSTTFATYTPLSAVAVNAISWFVESV